MKTVLLQQSKPQQATILGGFLLVLTPVLWYFNEYSLDKILLILCIGIVLIGYSITYEIREGFDYSKRFNIFGIPLWKQRLELLTPDYISLFASSFKKDNDWGAVSALGTKSNYQSIVIKFFKGPKNEIVYKSNDYNEALSKANELALLLNVRVHDTVKKSST